MEQRCSTLQEEVSRLNETSVTQAQALQERLAEAIAHLKLLGHAPLTSSNETGT